MEEKFNRQQKVMKFLTEVIETNPEMAKKLKSYKLSKNPRYGISFKKVDIQKTDLSHKFVYPKLLIVAKTPSSKAGMKKGQRLIAVNGKYVNKQLHNLDDILDEIDSLETVTELTVIDQNIWNSLMENPSLDFKQSNIILEEGQSLGMGMNTNTDPKHKIVEIVSDSPAFKANLKESDVLIKINNKYIREKSCDEVYNLIQNCLKNNSIELTVIELPNYNELKNKNMKKLVKAANTRIFTYKPNSTALSFTDSDNEQNNSDDNREIDNNESVATSSLFPDIRNLTTTTSNSEVDRFVVSIGVNVNQSERVRTLIRAENDISFGFGYLRLPKDYFICEIDNNTPASEAGLLEGDRIISINDENVENDDISFDRSTELINSDSHELKLVVKHDLNRFNQSLASTPTGIIYNVTRDSNEDFYGFNYHFLNDNLFICDVEENSPASRANLRRGFHILKINGDSVIGLDSDSVQNKMRSRGNQVQLDCDTDISLYDSLVEPEEQEEQEEPEIQEVQNQDDPTEQNEFPTCSICFEQLGRGVITTPCGHCFHTNCIDQWIQAGAANRCPTCRQIVDRNECRQLFF